MTAVLRKLAEACVGGPSWPTYANPTPAKALIQACTPETIIALLDRAETAEQELADLRGDNCAQAQGAFGRAGCGVCVDCERMNNAALRTMLHRLAKYWREDECVSPRATRMERAIARVPELLGGTSSPDLAPSSRMAARSRRRLDGADAQALEGALSMTERERDEARAERDARPEITADDCASVTSDLPAFPIQFPIAHAEWKRIYIALRAHAQKAGE